MPKLVAGLEVFNRKAGCCVNVQPVKVCALARFRLGKALANLAWEARQDGLAGGVGVQGAGLAAVPLGGDGLERLLHLLHLYD